MNFSTRLKQIIIKKGLSIRAFEEKLGCSVGTINRCINKKTDIGSSLVMKIIDTYNDVNPEWLLTGKGAMMKDCISCDASDDFEENYNEKKQLKPLVPLFAMAGQFPGESTVCDYDCEYYNIPGMDKADFLITVKGISMQPTYNSGDIVSCKRVNMDNCFFQWNRVYVLDTDQGPIIKRVKPGSDKEHILIVSDNDSYEPFELHLSQIYHIALVLGCIKLE